MKGREKEREEKREMVRQLEALRKSHFQWDRLDDGRYTTRKARLRSGIRGMLCTLVDGHFYWDTFGTRLPRCSFMIVDCGSWESIQCTNEWNELICWMRWGNSWHVDRHFYRTTIVLLKCSLRSGTIVDKFCMLFLSLIHKDWTVLNVYGYSVTIIW